MSSIPVVWAQAAENDIAAKTAADFGGVDPKQYHENKVQTYWSAHKTDATIQDSTKARIRRGAHTGGSNPNEPDHITVSFRKGAKELATVHVNTGR